MLNTSLGGWSAPTPVMLYRIEMSWSWSERICITANKVERSISQSVKYLVRFFFPLFPLSLWGNSNTVIMASLVPVQLVPWGVYYSRPSLWYTAPEFNNFVLTQSQEPDIAYYSLETSTSARTHTNTLGAHTHIHHNLAFLATTYSRIPLVLPQGALCILFGRIGQLQKRNFNSIF